MKVKNRRRITTNYNGIVGTSKKEVTLIDRLTKLSKKLSTGAYEDGWFIANHQIPRDGRAGRTIGELKEMKVATEGLGQAPIDPSRVKAILFDKQLGLLMGNPLYNDISVGVVDGEDDAIVGGRHRLAAIITLLRTGYDLTEQEIDDTLIEVNETEYESVELRNKAIAADNGSRVVGTSEKTIQSLIADGADVGNQRSVVKSFKDLKTPNLKKAVYIYSELGDTDIPRDTLRAMMSKVYDLILAEVGSAAALRDEFSEELFFILRAALTAAPILYEAQLALQGVKSFQTGATRNQLVSAFGELVMGLDEFSYLLEILDEDSDQLGST